MAYLRCKSIFGGLYLFEPKKSTWGNILKKTFFDFLVPLSTTDLIHLFLSDRAVLSDNLQKSPCVGCAESKFCTSSS